MVKRKPIKSVEDVVFDAANSFKEKYAPVTKAYKVKKTIEKYLPGFFIVDKATPKLAAFAFKDVVTGLTPVGDTGLYSNVGQPADPTDCGRYPDSPFCSMTPFSTDFIKLSPNITIDECNLGIRLDGSLGFIKMPPVSIVYRKSTCRNQAPLPKFIAPEGDYSVDVPFPINSCARDTRSAIVINISKRVGEEHGEVTEEDYISLGGAVAVRTPPGEYHVVSELSTSITSIEYPYTGDYRRLVYNEAGQGSYEQPTMRVSWTRTFKNTSNENYRNVFLGAETPLQTEEVTEHQAFLYVTDRLVVSGDLTIYQDSVENVLQNGSPARNFKTTRASYSLGGSGGYESTEFQYQVNVICGTPSNRNNPSPFTLNDEDTDMVCCPTTYANNKLLKELTEKVKKLSEIVGVDEYPASLPASLISKDEGFLGNLIPNQDIEIKSLTSLFGWYIERFDEIVGQFEIPIEIKDSDPTKPGDQPVGLKLPNIAESIAEMVMLQMQTAINTETLVNMLTRTLVETGQDKQQNFKSYMLIQAIAEYMGFEYKQTSQKLPFTFHPGKESLEEMLKECELDISVAEYSDKVDLRGNLNDLLQAAAIIKAKYWKKVDHKGDIKQQIIDGVKAYAEIKKVLGGNKPDEDGKDAFDKFLDEAEKGFTGETGISDATNPYGRSYDQRPKIKKLGNP